MKVTLKDIAAKSGLSVSVLSRVVSGNGYVSAPMRARAQEALSEFGYCRTIPRPSGARPMEDVIVIIAGATGNTYQQIIRSLTLAARKISKKVLTAHSNYESAVEEEYLRFAQQAGAYGVVMLSAVDTRGTVRLVRESPIPVVMMGRYTSQAQSDIVTQDSYEMGSMAARLLLQAGHRQVGYLGGHRQSSITRDKQLGFTDQLREAGLTLPENWTAYGALDYQSGVQYARQLMAMEAAPTALFVSNDLMAMGVIDQLIRSGCAIPRDLSLICCDKTLPSDTFHIALDRLYIDWSDTAGAAMGLLTARHKEPSRPRRLITFETQYIVGKTIAAPRASGAIKPGGW